MSDNKNPAPYSCATSGCLHDILATRLAAAETERDAAYRLAEATVLAGSSDLIAKGERRATAAIVADLKRLRRHEAYYGICFELDNLADRYERGKHLKGTSNE